MPRGRVQLIVGVDRFVTLRVARRVRPKRGQCDFGQSAWRPAAPPFGRDQRRRNQRRDVVGVEVARRERWICAWPRISAFRTGG
jgi:hypothetical protein